MWLQKSRYAGGGPSNRATAPMCMCEFGPSCARNAASTAVSRSPCCWPMIALPREALRLPSGRERADEPDAHRDDQHDGEHELVAIAAGQPGEQRAAGDLPDRGGGNE